jgi:heterodisulfide reductase subunit A-like polyferredoxin
MSAQKKNGSVMIVGAGIGGIQAALNLAEAGFKVYLVEKSPAIGGTMPQLDKTFPTNDCAMCILSPKLVECGRHLNIEVLTCAEVLDIQGEEGNFDVAVRKHPRYIDLKKCTGCGDCAQVCPVELPSEFDQGLALRKATYRSFAQAFPSAFAIDKRGKPPCRLACPAGVNVQGYTALISQGKFDEALALIKDDLPLPGVLGRICTHPCEGECNRRVYDQAVSICALKRVAADRGKSAAPAVKASPRNDQVAVVGSGPAGLSAAYFLAREGYPVTIFEALPVVGGMLAVGIPEYRLPRAVLSQEVQGIIDLGVEIRTGTAIGQDLTVDGLFEQGYKALFIATGAHGSQKLGIPGEDAAGVMSGVAFLRQLNLGNPARVGQRVAVVGGGNVAIDAARSARRLGAAEVGIFYRRTRAEMPAASEEVEAAEAEGVKINYLVNPTEILLQDGRVYGLRCLRMKLGEPDASGRRRPEPLSGTEFDVAVDTVIPAIGQVAETDFLAGSTGLAMGKRGDLAIDPATLTTSRPGVFAGGDLQSGPATAVEAIAAGRKAARGIARYLQGEKAEAPVKSNVEAVKAEQVPPPGQRKARYRFSELPVPDRVGSFAEVNQPFGEEEAIREAQRCLNCGICSECLQCVAACKAEAVDHGMREETVQIQVGSLILCPGFDKFNPSGIEAYGYGKFPNVVTSAEFERILSASGPYQGILKRPSDGQHPLRIAWLQCVGSRDAQQGHEYCSSVCCTYAIKEAVVAREHAGYDLATSIFFMDVRTFGKGFDDYAERAKSEYKVRFVRAKIYDVREGSAQGNLELRYASESGQLTREEFDLVVLSVGFEPAGKAMELAQRADVGLNQYGFCRTGEFTPVESSRPGILAGGAFQGPKDIPETVVQASAAAAASAAALASVRHSAVSEKIYPPEKDVAREPARVGVFICHCGLNIAGVVDVPALKDYAAMLPGVVYADNNLYTCSQDTQQKIKDKIEEHKLNRVVVASCSPRTHEPLFQETLSEVGLNRFLFEMANIRDQCSWVHQQEPAKATQKAKDLVRMAVARAAILEPLHKVTLGLSHEALVIGGGVAGLTVSLNLARQGFKTCLVEREKELGGWARKIYSTPAGNDVQAFLKDLITQVRAEPNIEVLTDCRLVKTEGFIGNFKSTVALEGGTRQRLLEHGVIVVATGAAEARPDLYLLGKDPRVMTLSDFEEKIARTPADLARLKNVVITLCARPPGMNYCSRVCCTSAIKNALKLKEANPAATVYVLYKDIRTYGLKEEFYTRAREAGIIFIRYNDDRLPKVENATGQLEVQVYEPILGRDLSLNPDWLVLATPMAPAEGGGDLSGILKVPLTKEGFFHEAHVKLAPVDFASEGIFMCGTAHAPKFLDETIGQALAAGGRAATILAKKQLEVGGAISHIDPEKCQACLTCVRLCPYDVPRINQDGVAEIDVAKCRGCGICAAECPRKAITLLHYREAQIEAKTEALLIAAH